METLDRQVERDYEGPRMNAQQEVGRVVQVLMEAQQQIARNKTTRKPRPIGEVRFSLKREGDVAEFMDTLATQQREYNGQAFYAHRTNSYDPNSTALSYIVHHHGASILAEDIPRMGRANFRVISSRVKQNKSEFLGMIGSHEYIVERKEKEE